MKDEKFILLTFTFLLFLIPGCEKGIKRSRMDVLFITVDTLRADHLGTYGYSFVETPNIDRLAEEGALWIPWWDDSANTSEDLSGSTLVLVTLLNHPGGDDWDNSWPGYPISTACGNAGDGMDFYKGKGIFREIKGDDDREKVFGNILSILNKT